MTPHIDYALLKTQRDWLLTLPQCDEAEGLINLLDSMLDDALECDCDNEPYHLPGCARLAAGAP